MTLLRSTPPSTTLLGSGAELLTRIGTGDRVAFAQLYDRLAVTVADIGISRRFTPDLTSEFVERVFLRIWSAAPRFRRTDGGSAAWVVALIDELLIEIGDGPSNDSVRAFRR